jgi:beta-glucosidase
MDSRQAPPLQPPSNPQLAEPGIHRRVEALLEQMTLEEKAGQLAQYSVGTPTGPGTGRSDYETLVRTGAAGSLLNVVGAQDTNRYQRIAVEQSRLKIPLLFGFDVIHGYRTTQPIPLGMASSFNPSRVEQAMRLAAREAAAEGIRWAFSPMVDIARDVRWGRVAESSGEDPYLGAALARAYVRGYQGTSLAEPTSVAASVKHFVGYGAAEGGRDYNTVDLSELSLRQTYLPPFQAAIEEGSATLMSAFNALNGVPATAHAPLLTDVLRKEWGFNGFVVSDWTAVLELMNHGTALDGASAATQALSAGVDMDMESHLYGPEVPRLVREGRLDLAGVDEAVRRVLRVKLALGLFESPYVDEKAAAYVATPDRRALARHMAEESIVLLENTGGVLPLSAAGQKIALVGPLADSPADMLGVWSAKGDPQDAVTLRAALEQRQRDARQPLRYAKGTGVASSDTSGFQEAVEAAAASDVVIAALGEDVSMSGEAASRTRIDLPGNQLQLLQALAATGKPVILIVFSGRPLALTDARPHARALVQAWHPGIEAGPALANLLWGDVNFSAHLPITFPRSLGQVPLSYNHLNTGRPAGRTELTRPPSNPAEKYVSRYLDEQNTPLYPFGHGLSYTTFDFSPPTPGTAPLRAQDVRERGANGLRVKTHVRNTGKVQGTVVAQLYLRIQGAATAQPVRRLVGFQRVELAPGASRELEFTLGWPELSFLDASATPGVRSGTRYDLWVGDTSEASAHASFTLE